VLEATIPRSSLRRNLLFPGPVKRGVYPLPAGSLVLRFFSRAAGQETRLEKGGGLSALRIGCGSCATFAANRRSLQGYVFGWTTDETASFRVLDAFVAAEAASL
jgi:hypothetical protein